MNIEVGAMDTEVGYNGHRGRYKMDTEVGTMDTEVGTMDTEVGYHGHRGRVQWTQR